MVLSLLIQSFYNFVLFYLLYIKGWSIQLDRWMVDLYYLSNNQLSYYSFGFDYNYLAITHLHFIQSLNLYLLAFPIDFCINGFLLRKNFHLYHRWWRLILFAFGFQMKSGTLWYRDTLVVVDEVSTSRGFFCVLAALATPCSLWAARNLGKWLSRGEACIKGKKEWGGVAHPSSRVDEIWIRIRGALLGGKDVRFTLNLHCYNLASCLRLIWRKISFPRLRISQEYIFIWCKLRGNVDTCPDRRTHPWTVFIRHQICLIRFQEFHFHFGFLERKIFLCPEQTAWIFAMIIVIISIEREMCLSIFNFLNKNIHRRTTCLPTF